MAQKRCYNRAIERLRSKELEKRLGAIRALEGIARAFERYHWPIVEVFDCLRTLDRKIADLNSRIEAEVEASGTTLTEIFGVGLILAASKVEPRTPLLRHVVKKHDSGINSW